MKSVQCGRNNSAVEITSISPHGFWLLMGEKVRFVSFREFPWFREATIAALMHVELPGAHHLYWPDLDIDLAVDSLEHPERYPLVSRMHPTMRRKPTAVAVKERRPAHKPRRKGRRRRAERGFPAGPPGGRDARTH